MKRLILTFIVLCGFMGGCSTIHFHNGTEKAKKTKIPPYEHWHHVGLLSLVEFTDPVDLKHQCRGDKWSTVTVERGLLHGLIWVIPGVNVLYSPWGVKTSCTN